MLSIIKGLLGFKGIAEQLATAYAAKTNAVTEQERIAAQERIDHYQALERVLIAEQGSWMTRWVRPAFALPFVLYIWKIVLWDKVLGWGVTDSLSDNLTTILVTIVGAYFITRPFEKVGQAWAAGRK